jgi:tetratricopeptide (TPR) repeat protein
MRYFPPLLLAAVVLVFDPAAYGSFHAPKHMVFLILIPLGYLVFVLYSIQVKRNITLRLTLIEILLVLRLIWLAATHPSKLPTGGDLGLLLLAGLVLCVLLVRQINPRVKPPILPGTDPGHESILSVLIRSIWILALIQAGIGLFQWVAYVDPDQAVYKTVLIGTIGPPNGYGIFLAAGVIACIADNRYTRNHAVKWITVIAACVIVFALLLNGSRGAIAGLICAGCLTVLLNSSRFKRPVLVYASVGIVIGIGIAVLYYINPVSADGRYMIWAISWPMFADFPFTGVGHGWFGFHYPDYQAAFFSNPANMQWSERAAALHQPHNEYLNAFIEGGLVNGILFIMIWGYSIIMTIRETLIQKDTRAGILYFCLTGILAAVLVHALVDDPFHVLPVAVIMYLMLGLIPAREWFTVTFHSSWSKTVLLLPALLCVLGMSVKAIDEYPAYWHWQNGLENARLYQWNDAVTWYTMAYEALPEKSELEFHMGAAYAMSGNYSEGINLINKALNRFRNRNLYLSLSYAYLQNGEIEPAIMYAEKAQAAFPDHLAPHLLLGELNYLAGYLERSKQSLLKCIHRETRIQSVRTFEISSEALQKWEEFFGSL